MGDDTDRLPSGLPPEFEPISRLGQGGFGSVYLARQNTIDRQVAIKVLQDTWVPEDKHVARFLQEATVLARLRHQHIVQVLTAGHLTSGAPYIVMEFLNGAPLTERFKSGPPFGIREAADLMRQIGEGLGAAHEIGVVHRDIKPDNVMLVTEGRHTVVKLLDFGIAKLRDSNTVRTAAAESFFTPTYMAPEIAQKGMSGVSPATDVYSTGVIFYRMLAGRPPFVKDNAFEYIRAHAFETPPPLPPGCDDEAPGITALVLRCLAKEPADRPANGYELADAIQRVLSGPSPAARPERVEPPAQAALVLDVSEATETGEATILLGEAAPAETRGRTVAGNAGLPLRNPTLGATTGDHAPTLARPPAPASGSAARAEPHRPEHDTEDEQSVVVSNTLRREFEHTLARRADPADPIWPTSSPPRVAPGAGPRTPEPPPAHAPRSVRRWALAAGAGVLAIACALLLWPSSDSGKEPGTSSADEQPVVKAKRPAASVASNPAEPPVGRPAKRLEPSAARPEPAQALAAAASPPAAEPAAPIAPVPPPAEPPRAPPEPAPVAAAAPAAPPQDSPDVEVAVRVKVPGGEPAIGTVTLPEPQRPVPAGAARTQRPRGPDPEATQAAGKRAYEQGLADWGGGRAASAADHFSRCVQLTGRPVCHKYLGMTHMKLGRAAEARRHLERYLKKSPNAGDADAVRSLLSRL